MTTTTMATTTTTMAPPLAAADLAPVIARACDRIAPSWPLDRLIAVNPWWGYVDAPIERAAAELTALSGATPLMPRAWYRAQWEAGRFAERHLARAIADAGSERSVGDLLDALARDEPPAARWLLMTDAADVGRDLGHAMSWGEYVTRQVSQACAACFDEGQAHWVPDRVEGLYPLWRELASHDGGPWLLMGVRGFRDAAAALPADPRALIAEAVAALDVPAAAREGYLTALLLSVNGWASACAFRRWEARLAGGDDDQLVHLLAVRLAWELLLLRLGDPATLPTAWRAARWGWASAASAAEGARRDDWLLQHALELAYQEGVARALSAAATAAATPAVIPATPASPTAQAVFCIDVRSEVFRRALEQVAPSVQTLGFAGFFGLPIAYQPLAGPARPQLPGLLAPSLVVEDEGPDRATAAARAAQRLGDAAAWKALGATAASTFSFVEAAGLGWAAALVRDGFGLGAGTGDPLRAPAAAHPALRPALARGANPSTGSGQAGGALELPARVALAAGVLRAMSLTRGFAPVLALVGHGASTENNPLAAGLHCGACGGQTGEVNARALAALLNDPAVRAGLAAEGIDLADTHVVAGLHDTTTDAVTLYDLDRVPPSHAAAVATLGDEFAAAGRGARRERAAALGLGGAHDADDASLARSVRARARDWSEVRPEWGLAGNAAFVVAPRERTRGVDLAGRAFLHEYRWEQDAGFGVLELILTAPMVVTHWINLQYYASTVDPLRYGSGNKVLHNVVGGRLGVMEGAGGDLRIGLARQSVHDGRRWMHEPLRLSVFVEAPADAIDDILARHATVRDLVRHRWLFLHRIDPTTGAVSQRGPEGWSAPDGR
jgi:uncharacterized protein YbcC (UPF0753/DUF2309 family)